MCELLTTCSAFRVAVDDDTLPAMRRFALRDLAQRIRSLDERLDQVERRLRAHHRRRRTRAGRPARRRTGHRLHSAHHRRRQPRASRQRAVLRGAHRLQPDPASSGKTHRHRLNRGGDRQANAAIWRIAIVRMAGDERSQKYIDKRMSEGKSKIEAIRCLKRYIAREVFAALPQPAVA